MRPPRPAFGTRAWAAALLAAAAVLPTGCARRHPEGQRPRQPVSTATAPVPQSQAAPEQTGAARPTSSTPGAFRPSGPGGLAGTSGTVTIEQRPGGATWRLTDRNGRTTTTTTTTAVTEADLGVKLYPGAAVVSGGKTSGAGGNGADSWAVVELLTKDPFDKVATFYRSAYAKENRVVEGPGSLTIIVDSGGRGTKTITVTREASGAETRIALSSGS